MAAPNRNQHWVPKFYLRYFATPDTRDTDNPKIWAFPKREGREFITSTRNVAAQRDLCQPQVDKRLGDLESTLGNCWSRLCNERYPIDMGFKRGVSLFIATSFMRHPSSLEQQHAANDVICRALEPLFADPVGRESVSISMGGDTYNVTAAELSELKARSDNDIALAWGASILSESGWIAKQLLNRPWNVIVTDEPAFITSDRPVTLRNPARAKSPILHPRTAIHFSMCPTKLVVINQNSSRDGQIIRVTKDQSRVFNYGIFCSAYEHVFSAWDSVYVMDEVVRFGDQMREEHSRLLQGQRSHLLKMKLGRNDRCLCGSGLKYKHCCG